MTHAPEALPTLAPPHRNRGQTAISESRNSSLTPILVAVPICLLLIGCLPWVGPLSVRIDTGGVPYDDFVIQVGKHYGHGHGTDVKTLVPRIVSSGEDLTLGRMLAGPTLTSIAVVAFHPAFDHGWTMRARSFGSSVAFPAIRPVTWTEILENEGRVSMKKVYNHLESIRIYYVPAFPEEEHQKLRRYLPGLRELVARARFLIGDLHKTDELDWFDDASARKDLVRSLEAIDSLLQ
jgi:hypothetical protein